jgi:hypothetical protein
MLVDNNYMELRLSGHMAPGQKPKAELSDEEEDEDTLVGLSQWIELEGINRKSVREMQRKNAAEKRKQAQERVSRPPSPKANWSNNNHFMGAFY